MASSHVLQSPVFKNSFEAWSLELRVLGTETCLQSRIVILLMCTLYMCAFKNSGISQYTVHDTQIFFWFNNLHNRHTHAYINTALLRGKSFLNTGHEWRTSCLWIFNVEKKRLNSICTHMSPQKHNYIESCVFMYDSKSRSFNTTIIEKQFQDGSCFWHDL